MSDLNISTRQSGGVTIVDLSGKIALGESNRALHESIKGLIEAGNKNILLNLAKVTVIDSSGLGELVAGYASAERNGGAMKLANLSDVFDSDADSGHKRRRAKKRAV